MPKEDLKDRRARDSILLAVLRTELANHRTLLAFIKTALGMGATAIGLLKFASEEKHYYFLGLTLIPLSIVTLFFGILYFLKSKRKIESEKNDAEV